MEYKTHYSADVDSAKEVIERLDRVFNILIRISVNKQKSVNKQSHCIGALDRIYSVGLIGRMRIKAKEQKWKSKFYKYRNSFVSQANRQINLISSSPNLGQYATGDNKFLLSEVLGRKHDLVTNMIHIQSTLYKLYNEGRELVQNFEISKERNELQFREDVSDKMIGGKLMHFHSHKGLLQQEIELCKEAIDILKDLLDSAVHIAHENEIIARSFNSDDLKNIRHLLTHEMHTYSSKYKYLRHLLQRQRWLRGAINPHNLVAVHMTDYFPRGAKIRTTGAATEGNDYIPRETIHFTLNDTVSQLGIANWDSKKYAILIPFEKVANRFINLHGADSFILGDLKLPDGTEVMGRARDLHGRRSYGLSLIPISNGSNLVDEVKKRIVARGYYPMVNKAEGWKPPKDLLDDFVSYCNAHGDANRVLLSLANMLGVTSHMHFSDEYKEIERITEQAGRVIDLFRRKETKKIDHYYIRGHIAEIEQHISNLEHMEIVFPEQEEVKSRLITYLRKIQADLIEVNKFFGY